MIGKICGIIYGFGTSLLFLVLYLLNFLGLVREAMISLILIVAFVNGLVLLLINLTRYEGRFQWKPLYVSNKRLKAVCLFCFWISFLNILINSIVLFSNQTEQMNDTYAIRNLYSAMCFMSMLIGISFTVGLRNVVPKYLAKIFGSTD